MNQFFTILMSILSVTVTASGCFKEARAEEGGTEMGQVVQVTFRLHAPSLPRETRVFITGSVTGLGNWSPSAVEMEYQKDQIWSYQLKAKSGVSIEYKYTLGSWAKEGADAEGRPFANFELKAAASLVQNDRIDDWTDRKSREIEGQITGTVKYHRQVQGEGIRPRDVVVWLPPGYEADNRQRYPVLYMHDGQNLFDPATSSFGVDWQVDETCTRLIGEKQIPALIVVGVNNTSDRSREYMDRSQGDAYRRFIVEKLKPMIDAQYRTRPGRDDTYVGGSSAGGLCAFMLIWKHAETFSRALCLSPAFRFEREDGTTAIDYVSRVNQSTRPQESVRIYIDNGGHGVDQQLQPGVDAMIKALEQIGMAKNVKVVIKPTDPHNEAAWARRLPEALVWLLK